MFNQVQFQSGSLGPIYTSIDLISSQDILAVGNRVEKESIFYSSGDGGEERGPLSLTGSTAVTMSAIVISRWRIPSTTYWRGYIWRSHQGSCAIDTFLCGIIMS